MSVSAIDREVRAVDAIAKDPVIYPHRSGVPSDIPLMRIWPRDRQGYTSCIRYANIEDILREFVQRVAPWRGPAHPKFQRSRRNIPKTDRHIH